MSKTFQLNSNKKLPRACCKISVFKDTLSESRLKMGLHIVPALNFKPFPFHRWTSRLNTRADVVRLCCQRVCYSPWCSRPPCRHPAGPVCTEPFHSSASTPMSPAHCYCTEPEAHRWTLLRCTNAHSEWHPPPHHHTHTFWVTHPLSSATLLSLQEDGINWPFSRTFISV